MTPSSPMQQRQAGQAIPDADFSCLLVGVLSQVRWVVLAALLLLSVAQPLHGRIGMPTWGLIVCFVGYNLLLELLRSQVPVLQSFVQVPLLDLPVAAVIYALGATPGGPLFVLFLLITSCAAASWKLSYSVAYTAVVVMVVAAIAPTLPLWSASTEDIRELGVQLIVIVLVGVGTALLTRRLVQERLAAQSSRDEAERLEELDRLRTTFIATISHDLRTPLTAAKAGLGMLEVSTAERLRPEERQLMHTVQRNIERLDRQIGDLLALNQIEAGALHLQREQVDLCTVVRGAVSAVQPLLEKKGQTLTIRMSEPLLVAGDPWRLEQVLVNLLCNAHEHTPAGTQVTVTGHAGDADVLLTVRDTGGGIPPGAHVMIFQSFQRLGTSRGGSGLGLAIVQGIISLHGGRVWVESTPGQGAAFHLALPAANTTA